MAELPLSDDMLLLDGRTARASEPAITIKALLEALPEAVYMTDPNGLITFYNEAAAELWGTRPDIGRSTFCGSWRLRWPCRIVLNCENAPVQEHCCI